jgi:transmembrane sensor
MKKVDPIINESEILEEATQWVVEMNSGELSDARTKMLHEWLRTSPLHEDLLLEASDVWDETKNLVAENRTVLSVSKTSWIFSPSMAVAALLLVTLTGVFLSGVMNFSGSEQKFVNVKHETRIGEFRTITLSDSSRVTLNTNSKISVAFDDQSEIRRIYLLQGEAYFDVAKDALRPFIVEVNKREVRAVGTAFNIRLDSSYIEVLVKEGIVEFVDLPDVAVIRVLPDRLTAGQVLEIQNGAKEVSLMVPEKVEMRLSWQTGRVVFQGDKLIDVVSELSRYTDTRFVFSDDRIESIRVGGSFRIGNVEELLELIKEGFDVNIEKRNDGAIVLSSANL